MDKPAIIPKGTFWVEQEKRLFLVRCPKCGLENYAMNVVTGICTWCGYNSNDPINYLKEEKKNKTKK